MFKKMKTKVFFYLLFCILSMYSCEYSETPIELEMPVTNQHAEPFAEGTLIGCVEVSNGWVTQIGIDHNENLKSWLHLVDIDSIFDSSMQLASNYILNYDGSLDSFMSVWLPIITQPDGYYEVKQLWGSSIVHDYLDGICEIIETASNFYEIDSALTTIQLDAQSELVCDELNAILVTISIAKASAKLWLPTELGGEGFYTTIGNYQSGSRSFWRKIGNVVCSDAMGGFAGFVKSAILTGGTGLVPGNAPGNAVIAAGTAYAAATASAGAAILNFG
jgi:hypothetical protein